MSEFIRKGEILPDALEMQVDVKPVEHARLGALNRLDFLLTLVQEEYPDEFPSFVEGLEKKYQAMAKKDVIAETGIDLNEVIAEFPLLLRYSSLARDYFNFFLQTYNLPDDWNQEEDQAKVMSRNQIRSFLLPRYYNLQTLIETIGREAAVPLYKKNISLFRENNPPEEKREYKSMESLFEAWQEPRPEPTGWMIVFGLVGEGKLAYKNENCLWVDALADLPDAEMKYLICCYGDYQGAKAFYDDSIILTMEHTIAEGDAYCSRVMHDTRVDWNLQHPPKEFWDEMEP